MTVREFIEIVIPYYCLEDQYVSLDNEKVRLRFVDDNNDYYRKDKLIDDLPNLNRIEINIFDDHQQTNNNRYDSFCKININDDISVLYDNIDSYHKDLINMHFIRNTKIEEFLK